MNISELKEITYKDDRFNKLYSQFRELLNELSKKSLSQNVINSINNTIEIINNSSLTGNELRKLIKQKQTEILKLVEKEFKIVPKNHYLNLWIGVGIVVFGIPIWFALNSVIGLMVGMLIGLLIGSSLDKKALENGKQLNIEIKH